MALADALLVVCILFYTICFRDISNLEFTIIAVILASYLWLLVHRRRGEASGHGHEHFVDASPVQQEDEQEEKDVVQQEAAAVAQQQAVAVAQETGQQPQQLPPPVPSLASNTGLRIDEPAYRNSLFALPYAVRDVLVPKLDYVIQSVRGGKTDNANGDDGMVNLDETEFLARKDPDVMGPDGNVDKDKMHQVMDDYLNIDSCLQRLEQLRPELHKKVLDADAASAPSPEPAAPAA